MSSRLNSCSAHLPVSSVFTLRSRSTYEQKKTFIHAVLNKAFSVLRVKNIVRVLGFHKASKSYKTSDEVFHHDPSPGLGENVPIEPPSPWFGKIIIRGCCECCPSDTGCKKKDNNG